MTWLADGAVPTGDAVVGAGPAQNAEHDEDAVHAVAVAVVGAGPAGLAAAVHAAEQGASTVLLDSAPRLGGQYWRHGQAATSLRSSLVPRSMLTQQAATSLRSSLVPRAMLTQHAATSLRSSLVPRSMLTQHAATSLRSSLVPRSMLTQFGPASDGLHHDLATYRDLIRRLERQVAAGRLTVRTEHQVWSVRADETGCTVAALDRRDPGRPAEVGLTAAVLVLAVGAYDRQVPFPGWDLPGVLTVGAAQALLKGSGVAVGPRVLVAGTGPFLLPVATSLAAHGAEVLGVHEANRPGRWLARLPAAAAAPAKLGEAAGYAVALARHRIPVRTRSVVVAAHGSDRLEAVTVARLDRAGAIRPGSRRRIAVDVLAVGYGFSTQSELPLQAGCTLTATADATLAVSTDGSQQTSNPRVFAAGETTGVGGAQLAVAEGIVAGIAAARAAGHAGERNLSPAAEAALLRSVEKTRDRLRRFAAAMHAVYPVPRFWLDTLEPATVVCRCEEVTVAEIDTAIELGGRDARSVKLLSRAGMGWCQGRVCGYATGCLTAARTGRPADLASGANRPVAVPIPLGLLAQTETGPPQT